MLLNCKSWDATPPARSAGTNEGQRRNVVVGGGRSHKLLYSRQETYAGFVSSLEAEFLQILLGAIQAKFVATAAGFDNALGKQQNQVPVPQGNHGGFWDGMREEA